MSKKAVVSPSCLVLLGVLLGTPTSWSTGAINWRCGQRLSTTRYMFEEQPSRGSSRWKGDIFGRVLVSDIIECYWCYTKYTGQFLQSLQLFWHQTQRTGGTGVGAWHRCLLLRWFQRPLVSTEGLSRRLTQSHSCLHDSKDGLFPCWLSTKGYAQSMSVSLYNT